MRMNLLDICRQLETICIGMTPRQMLSSPTGAAIDSRAVKSGDLFFCLPGERADGHDFAAAAVENGAIAVIGLRNPFGGESPVPFFEVPDVTRALGILAIGHRMSAKARVVGITGTSGKTSVKEALAFVLSEHGRTEKNHLNLNNQIGLPLSMLNADEDADYWVMEAGISRAKDMDELGNILRPDVALILNAGAGHIQGLGDKGVAHYKAKLLAYLARNGQAIVNADYPDLLLEARVHCPECITFSAHDDHAPYSAFYNGPESAFKGRYSLSLKGKTLEVAAPFQGDFGAENVAAIGAVAHLLGLADGEIAHGLAKAKPPAQRFSTSIVGPFLIIDDSYNANPLSMERMTNAAADMAEERCEGLFLVLGEMGELGEGSANFHEELGKHLARLDPLGVFWIGGYGSDVARGLDMGNYAGLWMPVADEAAFIAALQDAGMDAGVVLIKGSRSNRLERLVAVVTKLAKEGLDAL